MRLRDSGQVRELLNDLDFPADKEAMTEHVRRRAGRGTEAEEALAALPLGEYASLEEVLRSVPLDPAPDRTEAERASQRRAPHSSRIAEHMRPAQRPPVEEDVE